MKYMVTLWRYDCMTGETEMVADAPCLYDGARLLYVENGTGARHTVRLREDGLRIERKADVESIVELSLTRATRCIVKSPYGDMSLDARLVSYKNNGDVIEAEYILYAGTEIAVRQKMTWKMKKSSDVIDKGKCVA